MTGMNPGLSQDGIAEELVAKAAELWGHERAEATRTSLGDMAAFIWLVSQNLPDREEEPAFFF